MRKAAERELSRLERLPSAAAEHGVIRTYLEWILTLPWDASTPDNLDLEHAQSVLDQDHYDLEKVKERIIEYLAVSKLKDDLSGPILCFVGPPGVGKTSLGHSIANALGRKFVRISVGGVRDEAEIRGHRRTYIGAMPGTIIRALRDAESRNPVFLIDEIDKMGNDFRGDPSSAMLEVLDPEQHSSFRDHYLDLPFDLSKMLFICTANTTDTIPSPLLDRMDVIQLSGYTEDEKFGIARKYLIPKQLRAHGLTTRRVAIHDKALRLVIREYTREAGVRNLERQIAALLRKAATQIARGAAEKLKVDESARARVARAAAVSQRGPQAHIRARRGDRARVDARRRRDPLHRGGRLRRQGPTQADRSALEVMQESAQTAFSWVRSRAVSLQLDPGWFASTTCTSTFPPVRSRRTGPRRASRWRPQSSRWSPADRSPNDVGMTGEVTLTGQVLPIGGVREKVLAAQRAGLKRVILPRENGSDLDGAAARDARRRWSSCSPTSSPKCSPRRWTGRGRACAPAQGPSAAPRSGAETRRNERVSSSQASRSASSSSTTMRHVSWYSRRRQEEADAVLHERRPLR